MTDENTQLPTQGTSEQQPVASDKDGNPLYAKQPQFVHLSRAVEPAQQKLSLEVIKMHEESKKKYPHLNLSHGEYILIAVKRHPIGLLKIWFIGLVLIGAFLAMYYLL